MHPWTWKQLTLAEDRWISKSAITTKGMWRAVNYISRKSCRSKFLGVGYLLFDLQKAFDGICQTKLLQKLLSQSSVFWLVSIRFYLVVQFLSYESLPSRPGWIPTQLVSSNYQRCVYTCISIYLCFLYERPHSSIFILFKYADDIANTVPFFNDFKDVLRWFCKWLM